MSIDIRIPDVNRHVWTACCRGIASLQKSDTCAHCLFEATPGTIASLHSRLPGDVRQ